MTSGYLMTRDGLNSLLNSGYLGTISVPTKINVGIGTVTPTVADTELGKKIPISGTETIDDCETDNWSDGTDTGTTLNTTLFKVGASSLSVAKSGTTVTNMSVSKTTTSIDFTSKDFWIWFYFVDITDLIGSGTAITVRFGSDSSNYYYFDINISLLANGWNTFTFSSATATGTTGSPLIAACDYSEVIFNVDNTADTIAADRVLMDDLKAASAGDYDRIFDSGYPAVDEVASEVEMQTTLGTTDAIGYPLTEVGHLDTSDELKSHSVQSADNKTTSDIFIEIERIKVLNSF